MKTKQKAKELVDKFSISVHVYPHHYSISLDDQKDCALICVDEMIEAVDKVVNEIESDMGYHYGDIIRTGHIGYLQKVKKEIKKL